MAVSIFTRAAEQWRTHVRSAAVGWPLVGHLLVGAMLVVWLFMAGFGPELGPGRGDSTAAQLSRIIIMSAVAAWLTRQAADVDASTGRRWWILAAVGGWTLANLRWTGGGGSANIVETALPHLFAGLALAWFLAIARLLWTSHTISRVRRTTAQQAWERRVERSIPAAQVAQVEATKLRAGRGPGSRWRTASRRSRR